MKSIKPFDIVVILFIFVITIYFMRTENEAIKKGYIIIDEKKYPLNLDQNGIIDLKIYGKNMKVEVKDKKARISESDCRDKICIHMGYIKDCGDSAICLPNKTAIVIECEKNRYDGISR